MNSRAGGVLDDTLLELVRSSDPLDGRSSRTSSDTDRLLQSILASPRSTGDASRGRHRLITSAAASTAAIAFISVASAFGFGPRLLDFFDAPQAPEPVVKEFGDLVGGAPAGMDPQAIVRETRKVDEGWFGGATRTLWVAPTSAGGFCYLWTAGVGGCGSSSNQIVDPLGRMATPPGSAPIRFPPPSLEAAYVAAAHAAHAQGVAIWLVGYVTLPSTSSVIVRFSDGSSAQTDVVWVSSPIDASFFHYDIPVYKRTKELHAVAVDALDAQANVLGTQEIR